MNISLGYIMQKMIIIMLCGFGIEGFFDGDLGSLVYFFPILFLTLFEFGFEFWEFINKGEKK